MQTQSSATSSYPFLIDGDTSVLHQPTGVIISFPLNYFIRFWVITNTRSEISCLRNPDGPPIQIQNGPVPAPRCPNNPQRLLFPGLPVRHATWIRHPLVGLRYAWLRQPYCQQLRRFEPNPKWHLHQHHLHRAVDKQHHLGSDPSTLHLGPPHRLRFRPPPPICTCCCDLLNFFLIIIIIVVVVVVVVIFILMILISFLSLRWLISWVICYSINASNVSNISFIFDFLFGCSESWGKIEFIIIFIFIIFLWYLKI